MIVVGRPETEDRRRETEVGRPETEVGRPEFGDRRPETGDGRLESGDGSYHYLMLFLNPIIMFIRLKDSRYLD